MCAVLEARPGEIEKVLWLVETFPEEIEADLQRYFGINFTDLFRPRSGLTWRRFSVLVGQLPPESATSTAIRNSIPEDELEKRRVGDPRKAPWSSVESLLATLIDEVRNLSWMYAQSHSRSWNRPEPIPRPGVQAGKRRRQMSIEEIKAIDPRLRGLSDEEALERFKEMTGRG